MVTFLKSLFLPEFAHANTFQYLSENVHIVQSACPKYFSANVKISFKFVRKYLYDKVYSLNNAGMGNLLMFGKVVGWGLKYWRENHGRVLLQAKNPQV